MNRTMLGCIVFLVFRGASAQVDYIPAVTGANPNVVRVFACSPGGDHLTGFSVSPQGNLSPMRWSKTTGMQILETAPGFVTGTGWDLSDDGSVIVGEATLLGAFRWENGVMEILPSLPGGPMLTEGAAGISHDGTIVVGATYSSNGQECTIWEKGAAPVGMLNVHPTIKPFGGQKITSEGVLIGNATAGGYSQAFRMKAGVLVALGDIPGGSQHSFPRAVTPDGSVVVGYSSGTPGSQAFYWTERTGMVNLGALPGSPFAAAYNAQGVANDGMRVVGEGPHNTTSLCGGWSGQRAFVWDPIMGMQVLQDIVEEEQGAPLGTHILITAFDCSADGTYVVGEALKLSNCAREGYRAKIKPFCYADCDQSPGHKRTLDAFDFLCFIARFDQQDFYTDCDQNGEHDFFDLLCYINEFGKGCEP